MKQCIDLRLIAKERRWRWRYEESYFAEGLVSSSNEAPWYVEILCKYGLVYPYGGNILLACTEGHPTIRKRLDGISDEIKSHQGSDVVSFHVRHLNKVAAILQPRKKRNVSQETIFRGTANLVRYRSRNGRDKICRLESPFGVNWQPTQADAKNRKSKCLN